MAKARLCFRNWNALVLWLCAKPFAKQMPADVIDANSPRGERFRLRSLGGRNLAERWRVDSRLDKAEAQNQGDLTQPTLVLCEGKRDASFVLHLPEHRGIGESRTKATKR